MKDIRLDDEVFNLTEAAAFLKSLPGQSGHLSRRSGS